MNLSRLRDPQRRAVYGRRIGKRLRRALSMAIPGSSPIFVLGLQRSGTSMLMDVFQLRPDTEVFDERRNSVAFLDHRLRDFDTVETLVKKSRAQFVCFKPIADSHLAQQMLARFPAASLIWMYRRYQDVANSRIRKFEHANEAIRRVCDGRSGGGWFAEGLADETRARLQQFDTSRLSDFDLACLAWWARNRIFVESGLSHDPRVILIQYEDLVGHPHQVFGYLFRAMGMCEYPPALRFVRASAIGRYVAPAINPDVAQLCDALLRELDGYRRYSTSS